MNTVGSINNHIMKFLVTIDTEGDNQWDHGRKLGVENIKFVPRFQTLCEKYNIRPTYLVTSEVCEDPYAREIFTGYIKKETAEVGAHLHSWTTPPFLDREGYRYNDSNHTFASELPPELLREKLNTLTLQIEEAFGKRPTSFRSGRYGFNDTVARVLAENSYIVDSSVTPFTNWVLTKGAPDGKGGPDFSDKPVAPYMYNFDGAALVEIPVTVIPTTFPFNRNHKLAGLYFGNLHKSILLRGLRKLFYPGQPLWLRPFEWSSLAMFEEVIDEAFRINLEYVVMMFHSSELMPGCSKYRKDEESVEKLYELLEGFYKYLKGKNITSATLTEAAKEINL